MAQEAAQDGEGQDPASQDKTETAEAPEAPATASPATGGAKTFPEEYVKELRSEAAKHRKAAVEAQARLQEREDAEKSELERATAKLERAEKAQAEAEARLVRYEVAAEKAIPPKLVPLLTGSTKEELEAQATLILEAGPTPSFDGGARTPEPDARTADQRHNDTLLEILGVRPTQT